MGLICCLEVINLVIYCTTKETERMISCLHLAKAYSVPPPGQDSLHISVFINENVSKLHNVHPKFNSVGSAPSNFDLTMRGRRIGELRRRLVDLPLWFTFFYIFVSVSKFDQRLTTYFIALFFFLQERSFLLKTLGMESPSPNPSSNPSQPPTCKRALLHSL